MRPMTTTVISIASPHAQTVVEYRHVKPWHRSFSMRYLAPTRYKITIAAAICLLAALCFLLLPIGMQTYGIQCPAIDPVQPCTDSYGHQSVLSWIVLFERSMDEGDVNLTVYSYAAAILFMVATAYLLYALFAHRARIRWKWYISATILVLVATSVSFYWLIWRPARQPCVFTTPYQHRGHCSNTYDFQTPYLCIDRCSSK